jgi:WD40 repeat protein/tetratricopeptide (TPR) repeat protein
VAVAFSPDGRTVAAVLGDSYYRGRSEFLGPGDSVRGGRLGLGGRSRLGDPISMRSWELRNWPPPPLWDAAAGTPRAATGLGEPLWSVAFSPDGRSLVTGGGRYRKDRLGRRSDFSNQYDLSAQREWPAAAHLWDLTTGRHVRAFPHENAVLAVALSPDGRHLVTGSADQTAQLWDLATGQPVGAPLTHDGIVLFVAFSPDGRFVLTCSQRSATEGAVHLWNAETGQAVGSPWVQPRAILAAAFSPDGRLVATASGDTTSHRGEVQLWAAATGKPLGAPFLHPAPVHAVAWSPDGRRIVTGCADKVARVWEALPVPAVVPVGHHENVLAYSPDGRRVLLGTIAHDGQRCDHVSLGETGSSKAPLSLPFLGVPSGRAVFSPDGRHFLLHFHGDGAQLRLFDAVDGRLLGKPVTPKGGEIEAMAVSPDGHTILAGTSYAYQQRATALLWDANTGQGLQTFAFTVPVLSVAFSPDGHTIAAGSGNPGTAQGETRLYEVRTGRLLHKLAHEGPVRVVLFSPDGRTLAAAGDERVVRLWDVAGGRERTALAHGAAVRAVAWSADGRLLLTGSDDQTAQLWDVTTGKRVGQALKHRAPVRAVAVSGDGRLLATGGDDRIVNLWEAATGRAVEEPLVHGGPVQSVAFAGDGRMLLTRSTLSNTVLRRRVGNAWETTIGTPWKSTGRLWALPAPVADDPAAVVLQVQVATGQELDADSRVRVLDAAAWRQRRERLGKQGDPAQAAAALREWHRREARVTEAAGEWFATAWHLDRVGDEDAAADDLHARRGRAYALCGRWEPAVTELTKTLHANDPRMELWYLRGLAHFAQNHNREALADFNEAIRVEPIVRARHAETDGTWVIWFRRGQTCLRLRDPDQAIADFSQVLKLSPDHGLSWYGRGQAHAEKGELERAAADFAVALQRPGVPASVACDVAQARLGANDASGYREACAEALRRFGETDDPVLAASLAWTCSLAPGASADPKRIVGLADRALSRDASSYLHRRARGAALYREGRYAEVVEQFERALQVRQPPAPSAWLFLALAHQRLGQSRDARRWLDKARAWTEQARRQAPGKDGDEKTLSWQRLPWSERLALTLLQREAQHLLFDGPDRATTVGLLGASFGQGPLLAAVVLAPEGQQPGR